MKSNRKLRKQKYKRPMDPGSTTEEEYHVDFTDNYSPSKQERHSHSLMFMIFRFPILFVAFLYMFVDLLCYALGRCVVSIQELILEFNSTPKKLKNELTKSSNYKEWIESAKKIDKSLGLDQWKSKPTDEAGFDEH
ncbi:hypothetical protein BC833DRAFT_619849, partial [Globomyces pollinis-pini]